MTDRASERSRAEALFEQGELRGALEIYSSLLAEAPGDAELLSDTAAVHFALGQLSECRERLGQALCADPCCASALENLRMLCRATGRDYEAERVKAIGSAGGSTKTRLLCLELPGIGRFMSDLASSLQQEDGLSVRHVLVRSADQELPFDWADVVWLEWANQLAVRITRRPELLQGKKVVIRLHRFEAFTDLPRQINWSVVDQLVFVSQGVREIFAERFPHVDVSNVVIPNGVDMDRFALPSVRSRPEDVAFVAHMRSVKNVPLVAQIAAELEARGVRRRICMAGDWQDPVLERYMAHMRSQLGLQGALVFEGWVSDMPGWMQQKGYVLCTSLMESFGYSVFEGMSCGLTPVVHNFPGADESWPRRWRFNTAAEGADMLAREPEDPHSCRAYVQKHFSREHQVEAVRNMLEEMLHAPSRVAGSAGQEPAAGRILRLVRSERDLQSKIARLGREDPDGSILRDDVRALPPGEVVTDDDLSLAAAWCAHRQGDAAGREYHLCCLSSAGMRADARRALGVELSPAPARTLWLVTVDCLRADRLSQNGYRRPTTPALDALAATGVNFPYAYSTAGQTAQSFPGIMLSNFFQNFGRSRAVPPALATLAEVLSNAGWHTVAYNAANPHISHFYGYDRGFDEFHDFIADSNRESSARTFRDHSDRRLEAPGRQELSKLREDCQAHPDIFGLLLEMSGLDSESLIERIAARRRFYPYDAADIVLRAIRNLLLDADARDRFIWLHLMDVHENITVRYSRLGAFSTVEQFFLNSCLASPIGLRLLREEPDKYGSLYDSAVSYVDIQLEVLGRFLADAGLLGASLLAITADHGQELLEDGRFGHGYDRLTEGVLHVPLIFAGGLTGSLRGVNTARPVSTLDLAPTLLEAVEVVQPESFLGRSLSDPSPRPVIAQTFYEGADNNRRDGGRSFYLDLFPKPVRECCPQMFACIEQGWIGVQDSGRGSSDIRPLSNWPRRARTPPEGLCERAQELLARMYAPARNAAAADMTIGERKAVTARLADLGYL